MRFLKDTLVWGATVGLLLYSALLIMAGMICFVTFDQQYLNSAFVLLMGRACICIGLVVGVVIAMLQDE